MYTGSIGENRVYLGIPPVVRDLLLEEAKLLGMQVPEVIRHILLCWREDRLAQRETRK